MVEIKIKGQILKRNDRAYLFGIPKALITFGILKTNQDYEITIREVKNGKE
jgi:hypothetical protein